ncbi:hypothetical protein [Desulfocastanea catecholica]
MERIKHLLSAMETIEKHGDPATAAWFREGLQKFMTGSERAKLDACLGLSGSRGKSTSRTLYAITTRNKYLSLAMDYIDKDLPNMTKCEQLADAIKAFESRIYPRVCDLKEPPAEWSEQRKYLFMAKRTGAPLTTKWRSLHLWIFGI